MVSSNGHYDGVISTIIKIIREEGSSALFKGILPRTIWISIGGSIFLGAYEQCKSLMTS